MGGSQKPETRPAATARQCAESPTAEGVDDLEWWRRLPGGERAVIRAVVRMLRSARRSEVREVARAAAKWARGLGCFIKVRLMWEKERAESKRQECKRPFVDDGRLGVEGKKKPGPHANG